ncbi:ribokinase [bacterium]|nr:ribokinase [bacterium]
MSVNITVVGSICLDFGIMLPHLPVVGETVLGTDLITPVGGKGFNQALQAHRLGSRTHFFGRLGDDAPGRMIIDQLENEDFPVRGLRVLKNEKTALGLILIGPDGRNMIGGFSGANMNFNIEDIDQNVYDALLLSTHLILQLEIPDEVNLAVLRLAKEQYVRTILNFAPYRNIPEEIENLIDIFIFNEIEASAYFEREIRTHEDFFRIRDSKKYLFEKIYIVTLGEKGAAIIAPEGEYYSEGIAVDSIDSTGAGDSFVGAYVHFIASGRGYIQSIDLANIVAAESTTKPGAMPGMPGAARIETLIREHNIDPDEPDE